MNEQPAEKWEAMDTKRQDEIVWQSSILAEIRDSKAAAPTHRHVVMQPNGRLYLMPSI